MTGLWSGVPWGGLAGLWSGVEGRCPACAWPVPGLRRGYVLCGRKMLGVQIGRIGAGTLACGHGPGNSLFTGTGLLDAVHSTERFGALGVACGNGARLFFSDTLSTYVSKTLTTTRGTRKEKKVRHGRISLLGAAEPGRSQSRGGWTSLCRIHRPLSSPRNHPGCIIPKENRL